MNYVLLSQRKPNVSQEHIVHLFRGDELFFSYFFDSRVYKNFLDNAYPVDLQTSYSIIAVPTSDSEHYKLQELSTEELFQLFIEDATNSLI